MMNSKFSFLNRLSCLIGLLMLFTAGCSPALTPTSSLNTATKTSAPTMTKTVTPTGTLEPTATITLSPSPTPDLRLKPENWQNWPIIPELEPAALEIYRHGQALGRDPNVFSVIGDCQSSPTYFLSIYDEDRYTLPEGEESLQETIDWYAGSFEHRSVTVKNGMTAPGTLNPYWGDPDLCESKETPVACEVRLSNPSLILISLGTNWNPSTSQEDYIGYLNRIVDFLIEQGVLPVLSTKADNSEGDWSRNLAMAQVAYDRHLPLWNFWATVQDVPNTGLDKDRENVYLNYLGWDARNLSALELLDSLRRQFMAVE